MITLGIETSCDDTSICLLETDDSANSFPVVLAHHSFSQETILQEWGGVVPEIAARNHLAKVTPLLKQVFNTAKITAKDVDQIGVTTHPGLLGPLLTGVNAAKTISLIHHIPINPVNHLFAHLEAIHLSEEISYPYLGLLFSGGHSLFCLVSSASEFKIIASTIDDAAGEAFDKGGKMLGLAYPAGKVIDTLAKDGDQKKYSFPIGLKHSKDGKMSFSGVKTSLRTFIEKNKIKIGDESSQMMKDVCASYQEAIVQAILHKTKEVINILPNSALPIVLGGGVASNSRLRELLTNSFNNVHIVDPKYCTDNGAMIANYASRTKDNNITYPESLKLDARSRYLTKEKK
jgi:N6-L-threonylcarbamoyladenine synthase